MIFLRTSAVDDNEAAAASAFVGVATPFGVQDGDLIMVAIAVDASAVITPPVVITPPDASWTLVARSGAPGGSNVSLYWKYALNERARWVFSLSLSVFAQGVAAVYGGADGWQPVEAAAIAQTAASASQNIGGVSTSISDEELALFLCFNTEDTFTLAGYEQKQARLNTDTLAFARRPVGAPSALTATTATLTSGPADGASILVVLRPSASRLSLDDVRGLLVNGLPADANRVYDLDVGGDYYKLFQAIALTAKQVAFDLVELAQREILPRFARYKLPDWERVFGLTTTRAAQVGSVPARQAQVVSSWREAAGLGSTRAAITAILGPLLGYFPTTEVEVVTTDRDALRFEHSYEPAASIILPAASQATFTFETVDGGKVSTGGARLEVDYASGAGDLQFELTAPDGSVRSWSTTLDAQAFDIFFGAEFVGAQMTGTWSLLIANDSLGSVELLPIVFVEGVTDGRNDGQLTAAAMFDWGAYADPAHIAENGTPADFAAARRAVQRIAFSHTIGNLLQSLEPYPDVDAGVHSAIPDECIPT